MKVPDRWNRPLVRRALGIAAGLLVLWAAAGFLVLPHLLRPFAERKLTDVLHRPVTLRRLSLNPFALSATLEGLDVKEKEGAGPFFSFERLYVNLEAVSVRRGGPVIRAITLTKPSVALIRNEDGNYNCQDLLDEASKPKSPEGKPLRFSLNNIGVEGGSVDFDDRPKGTKHTVRDVRIGIPVLSNIPSKVEITTLPVFEAKVNGAPFALRGKTKPFSQTHETSVDLNIADLDVPYYLAYVPTPMRAKLTSGRLDSKFTVTFSQPPKAEPRLLLSGTAALRRLAVEMAGQPLAACERFEAALGSFDVFGRKARLASLKAIGPELRVRRGKTGSFDVLAALAEPASKGAGGAAGARAEPAKQPAAPARPLLVEVAALGIQAGRVHYEDLAFAKPFRTVLQEVAVSVKGFSTEPLVLEGEVAAGGVPLARYQPFLDSFVRFDFEDGVLDLKTKYRYADGAKAAITLAGLSAELKSPRLTKRGEKEPFFRAPSVTLTATSLDLGKRGAVVGELASTGGNLAVTRERDGSVDLAKLAVEGAAPAEAKTTPPAPWILSLGRLALDQYTFRINDRANRLPARYALTKTDLRLEKFSTAKGSKAELAVRFGVDGRGVASAKGPVGLDPIFADLKADVKGIPLVPLQAYVVQDFNVTLARGTLSAGGTLRFREGANGKASFTYAGVALVAGLLAVDRSTNLDFLKWESFSAERMKAGYNPMFLEVSRLALAGIGCEVTIESDGTTRLQRVVGKPAPPGDEEGEGEAPPQGTAS